MVINTNRMIFEFVTMEQSYGLYVHLRLGSQNVLWWIKWAWRTQPPQRKKMRMKLTVQKQVRNFFVNLFKIKLNLNWYFWAASRYHCLILSAQVELQHSISKLQQQMSISYVQSREKMKISSLFHPSYGTRVSGWTGKP